MKYSIAIIVTWFGNLPPYFPVWLKSAEANTDIDFYIFSDHDVYSDAQNIKFYKMTLEETLASFEKKLNRKINITNSYKFCDCRPFFGQTYSDYIKDYDFWGYCDIDLVFGNIRSFLTDEILEQYDRFYQYGHLSIFRNNETMNNLYDLPGGIYSYKEIFEKKAKTTPEEHFGINRICEKNNIRWYTQVDFVDFAIKYPQRLEAKHGVINYEEQAFFWKDGIAYRIYLKDGIVYKDAFVYMHWQKRKPIIEGQLSDHDTIIITGDKLIVCQNDNNEDMINLNNYNPILSSKEKLLYKRKYRKKKVNEFLKAPYTTKLIWLRQKVHKLIDGKPSYL